MKIAKTQSSQSFGRALTTIEKQEHEQVILDARKELGLDKTTATVFDFSVPSAANDTGIGTSFSEEGQKLAEFLKSLVGVNSIQLQPQGQISNYIRSPYSGSGFSLGMHIIDLNKLKEDTYGNLLTEKDLKSSYMTRVKDHNSVDYDNVFSEDGQKAMLQKAYKRFEKLDENSPLKRDFDKFRKENSYWLERDALFEACAVANGSQDMKTWSYRDQNVFNTKEGDQERIAQLKYVKDDKGNNVVDFEEFVQFIADRQQKESKARYNAQGIDIYGDCQIGLSQKDYWAHKSAFYPTAEFGCDIGGNKYSCWSPALDYSKMDGEAGELLYNKFDLFFKRYNGVRIDAAWQLIDPLICEPMKDSNGNEVFDEHGNKLGRKLDNQPKVKNNGKHIIENIVLKAADDNRVPHDKIMLELLGGNSYNSLDAVKDLGTTLIHISRYGNEKWGRVKYYESQGDNKYQNMKPGQYTLGPGTHDDDTLIEQAGKAKQRAGYLASDLYLNKQELENSPEALSEAILAEMFTTSNQFATLPDILGSNRRINFPNTTQGNWTYRAPQNYEEEYYSNLSKRKGLNVDDAMSKAIKSKHHGKRTALTDKLDYFANILRQDGPNTTKEADRLYLNA